MNARSYLTLMREHAVLIALCVVAGLGLAVLVTWWMPRSYASSASFYVTVSGSSGQLGASDRYAAAQLATSLGPSYAKLITSPRVAADAAARLGDGTTAGDVMQSISSDNAKDTPILTLTAKASSADRARAIAQAVSDSFAQLVPRLENTAATPTPSPNATAQPTPTVTAQLLQPAGLPASPVSPSLRLNLLIGLLVGLLVGFGAAVVRHPLHTRLRSGRQLAEAGGAPMLGAVPRDRDVRAHPVALTADAAPGRGPNSRLEAYRRIRSALQAVNRGRKGRVLVVASAHRGDGRTTTACNLAASLAAAGDRVVLVDGDLRNPQVARCLGLDPGEAPGLAEVVSGAVTLPPAVVRWEPGQFDVLAGGRPTARSYEELASRRAEQVLADLRAGYDYVIVDSAPLLSVADAQSLAVHSDGVVFVSRWRTTRRHDIEAAVGYLSSVSARVVGVVLNRIPRRRIATGDLAADAGTPAPAAHAPTVDVHRDQERDQATVHAMTGRPSPPGARHPGAPERVDDVPAAKVP